MVGDMCVVCGGEIADGATASKTCDRGCTKVRRSYGKWAAAWRSLLEVMESEPELRPTVIRALAEQVSRVTKAANVDMAALAIGEHSDVPPPDRYRIEQVGRGRVAWLVWDDVRSQWPRWPADLLRPEGEEAAPRRATGARRLGSKVTAEIVAEIKAHRLQHDTSVGQLAEMFNLKSGTVSDIVSGRTWADIEPEE